MIASAEIRVRSSTAADAPPVKSLLASAGLPVADLDTAPGLRFWVAEEHTEIVGAIGLERHGSAGLVRSLAVSPRYRQRGLGKLLVATLETQARAAGVEILVLLTDTAGDLFRTLGYRAIDRAYVPEEIRESAEFRSLCPASALCMMKNLAAEDTSATSPLNVLILCTGNSARSVLGEALFNHLGRGRVRAFSAGSHPTGTVNPLALRLLRSKGIATEGFRSKSWEEFAAPGAPEFAIVITVCDSAAGEACPVWPGNPIRAHWGLPDPAAVAGSDADRISAFAATYRSLEERISRLLELPIRSLDRAELTRQLRQIGAA